MGLDLDDGAQLKAARTWAGWGQRELAARSGLSLFTIQALERGGPLDCRYATARKLLQAFQAAGIRFVPSGVLRTEPANNNPSEAA